MEVGLVSPQHDKAGRRTGKEDRIPGLNMQDETAEVAVFFTREAATVVTKNKTEN